MKKKTWLLTGVLVLAVLIAAFGLRDSIGVPLDKLEQDARRSQQIPSSMQCAIHSTDEMAALLFYHDNSDDAIYSIYLKNEGLSFGYFFRQGGDLAPAGIDGVLEIDYMGKASAALSLNKKNVSRIITDSRITLISAEKPFALVFPPDSGTISMFDQNGLEVPFDHTEVHGHLEA